MKREFLICVFALTVVASITDRIYACCEDPVAGLFVEGAVWYPYNGYYAACVGTELSFEATCSYDPDCEDCDDCGGVSMLSGIRKFEWDWTNDGTYDHTESPGDGIATHTYSIPGTYVVKLKVTDDDDDCCCSGTGCSDKTDTTTIIVMIVDVQIGAIDRIPPTKNKSVQITVSPSDAPQISLDVIMTYGTTGSATVNPTAIEGGTTTVTVTGGAQSSDPGNLSLRGYPSLTCICDTESFTVCAHPEDFEAALNNPEFLGPPQSDTHYGMIVNYVWGSDSDDVAHLDQCKLSESFENCESDDPPFDLTGCPAGFPTFTMEDGHCGDARVVLKSKVHDYIDGYTTYDQEMKYTCERCTFGDSLSDNEVSHHVYWCTTFPGFDPHWRINHSVVHSCPGPVCSISQFVSY